MPQDAGDGDSRAVARCAVAVRAVHDELAACRDLQPGPVVDAAFRRLVRLVVDTPQEQAEAVLAHPALRDVADDLRSLCFVGEYQLVLATEQEVRNGTKVASITDMEFETFCAEHGLQRVATAR